MTCLALVSIVGGCDSNSSSSSSTSSVTTSTIAFQAGTSTTANENTLHLVEVVLSTGGSDLVADLTVNVTSIGGTATAGADYTAVATTLTFPVGSVNGTILTVELPVLDDVLIEGDETVVLELSGVSSGGSLGTPNLHTVTLTDDDTDPTIAFSSSASTTADESTPHLVEVVLSTGISVLTADLTVEVTSVGGTATALDYTPVATTLTFPAGSGNGSIEIVELLVQDDFLVEGDETIELALSGVFGHLFDNPVW